MLFEKFAAFARGLAAGLMAFADILWSFWYTRILIIVIGVSVVSHIVSNIVEWYEYRTSAYYRSTGRKQTSLTARNGGRCEYATYEALRRLEKEGWKFLFDLYIPNSTYGSTTQIDGLAIGPGGIVVIECKDFAGEIIGMAHDRNWEQRKEYLSDPNERSRWFYNPIRQNDGHIRHLSRLLGANAKDIPIFSLIVFSNKSSLSIYAPNREDMRVVQLRNVMKEFRKLVGNRSWDMDGKVVEETFVMLSKYTGASKGVRARHVRDCERAAIV